MSMTKEVLKKFVEEDYKDFTILVTCDNEHKFLHRSYGNPDIIWDWDNEVFIALEINQDAVDQNKHPMHITTVSLEEIQFITAFVDSAKIIDFINSKYTDDEAKEKAKEVFRKAKPGIMGPRTLRKNLNHDEYMDNPRAEYK